MLGQGTVQGIGKVIEGYAKKPAHFFQLKDWNGCCALFIGADTLGAYTSFIGHILNGVLGLQPGLASGPAEPRGRRGRRG